MDEPIYPFGTAEALIGSPLVTDATRAALMQRLNEPAEATPQFFSESELRTLKAVCDRLIPQPRRARRIDLAGDIDRRLASGTGDGWRYDAMPPDGAAYRAGLTAIEAEARQEHGADFSDLDAASQDGLLDRIQGGAVDVLHWQQVVPVFFFEELLAEATENYYSHPPAQDEIGYAGYADAPGWRHIGLNEREPREPEAVEQGSAA